jgi:hypothetical protein
MIFCLAPPLLCTNTIAASLHPTLRIITRGERAGCLPLCQENTTGMNQQDQAIRRASKRHPLVEFGDWRLYQIQNLGSLNDRTRVSMYHNQLLQEWGLMITKLQVSLAWWHHWSWAIRWTDTERRGAALCYALLLKWHPWKVVNTNDI